MTTRLHKAVALLCGLFFSVIVENGKKLYRFSKTSIIFVDVWYEKSLRLGHSIGSENNDSR